MVETVVLSWVIVHKISPLLLHQIKTWIGVMFTRIIISKTSQYYPRSKVFSAYFPPLSSAVYTADNFTLTHWAKQETEPDDEKEPRALCHVPTMVPTKLCHFYVNRLLDFFAISELTGVTMKNLRKIWRVVRIFEEMWLDWQSIVGMTRFKLRRSGLNAIKATFDDVQVYFTRDEYTNCIAVTIYYDKLQLQWEGYQLN